MTWSLSSLNDMLRKQLTCWLPNSNLIPRGTHGLGCAHIAQLMTHTVKLHMDVYLAIMLLKSLGILQRVTKSQRVDHISNKILNFKSFFAKKYFLYICGYYNTRCFKWVWLCDQWKSLIDCCNSIPNSAFVFYNEKYVNLKSFTFL